MPDPELLGEAAELLRRGRLVAFPTETVYGLGAHALDAAAVLRIYEAKGRPSFNPLIVHVWDRESARAVVREWPERAELLAAKFWPGPLTLVLPRTGSVPDIVTAGLDSVAVRVPSHPVALALLRTVRLPIAAPSANRSNAISPTTAGHVAASLGDSVDLILDAGPTEVGIESTVLDLTGELPVILRPGMISPQDLENVVGPLGTRAGTHESDAPRPSPGMSLRHYAPRARVHLYGEEGASAPTTIDIPRELVGAMVLSVAPSQAGRVIEMPGDAASYARRLYSALHELDSAGCQLILIERVPEGDAWLGVRDRLNRAAH